MDPAQSSKNVSSRTPTKKSEPGPSLFSPQERLSIPFALRLTLGGFMGFIGGASIGAAHGGKMAGMRFRAEHAHIFPTTTPGWYLYHKSKNYHAMLGAIKQGLRIGGKISIWAAGFLAIEETVDRWRGERDFISTVVAGLSVAGGFSAWNKFSYQTTVKTTKTGLLGSLAFGISQDAIGLLRGRRLRYVDAILGRRTEVSSRYIG